MQDVTLRDLLEAGCHFGHQVPKSNPKAREFVYTSRDNVQIIDLAKTKEGLEKAAEFVKTTVSGGGKVVFVGTKKQARSILIEEAKRCGTPYIAKRWVGGLLTNWEEVKKNLKRMGEIRENLKSDKWTKKEKSLMEKRLRKMETIYGGIEELSGLPQVFYIVDIHREEGAVKEARKLGVPIVGVVDTNADPQMVDYAIPANDDAVKSIRLITSYLADAVAEGHLILEKLEEQKAAIEVEEKEKATAKTLAGSKTTKKTDTAKTKKSATPKTKGASGKKEKSNEG